MTPTDQLDERVLRRLKLRELRILMTVAECRSMGQAAGKLGVSQPAVSKAITEMEHTLGVPLLERSVRGVVPTLYGAALLRWAVTVFDDLRQAIKEIEFLSDPAAGEVRIGSTEAMTAGLVPAVIDRLSRQFPRLVFSVRQAPTLPQQYEDLRARKIDLILGRMVTPIGSEDDLDAETLFEDPLFVVAARGSKWLRRRKIEPAELLAAPWCIPSSGSIIKLRLAEAFRAKGLEMPVETVTSTSIQLFSALLATGRFVALLSGSTLRLSGERLGLRRVPVSLPIRSGPVGIVTLKNRALSPTAQRFIKTAREVSKPLARI
jgi:DNA-binding transcriptional LysR family regulator